MRKLIDEGKKDQLVNRTAIGIVWNTPQFSETPKAQAIYQWVQANCRFITDMVGAETLRSARETLAVRAGDCDDFTILIASLLATIGIRSRAVTISSHSDDPQSFSHIYPEAFVDGRWIAMDVARPGAQFARSPEKYFRKREWDLFSPTWRDVSGLSGYMGCAGTSGIGCGCNSGMGADFRGRPLSPARGAWGRANRASGRSLGDFSDVAADVGQVLTPQVIGATTTGVAQIVAASSGVPPGYGYNAAGQLVPLSVSGGGISGSTLLLFLLLGGILLVAN